MKLDKQAQFNPFELDGKIYDLSMFNAHEVEYFCEKTNNNFKFFVTYSMHCFTKDYPHQTEQEKQKLLYKTKLENRPFCIDRYKIATKYLRSIIENLPTNKIGFAGHDNFATIKIIDDETKSEIFYKVVFVAYRYKKKLRLHIASAYPIQEWQKLKPVSFFKIADNLKKGKKLPHPPK